MFITLFLKKQWFISSFQVSSGNVACTPTQAGGGASTASGQGELNLFSDNSSTSKTEDTGKKPLSKDSILSLYGTNSMPQQAAPGECFSPKQKSQNRPDQHTKNVTICVAPHPLLQLACSWAPPRCSFLSRPPLVIRPLQAWVLPCHLQPSWGPWWLRVGQPWWGPIQEWWLEWPCQMVSWGTHQLRALWAWRRGWWHHRVARCLREWCPLRECTPCSLASRLSGTWVRYAKTSTSLFFFH